MDLTTIGQFRLPLGSEQWDIAHQNYNWNRADGLFGAQNFTSTTRPTTNLFAGRLIWETDTLKLMRYNGTGWDQVGGSQANTAPQNGFVTANFSKTDTTLAAVTGLSLAMVANARYRVMSYISYTGVAAADMKISLAGPAGATGKWSLQGPPAAATSQVGDIDMGSVTLGSILTAGCNAQESALTSMGWVTTGGTAGNLQFQMAQAAANATATVITAGSWMEILRVA